MGEKYYDEEKRRANYNYYLSIGKCPRCGGKHPVQKGKHVCRECSLKQSEQRREKRVFFKENGLCARCGKPLPVDSRFMQCQECRDYIGSFRKFNKARYESLKRAGKCVKCGDWAEPGRTLCKKCLDDHRKTEQSYGEAYRDRKRQRRQERIAEGLCIDCGRPTDNGHTRCIRCREMRMDSTRKYRIIKKIEKEAEEARGRAI